mgnify:CR=1 FL=1|tara:strand:- start:390 stop:1361 length:972 start_codon:yes stop_codon:yes gene_type:complete
MSKISAIRSYLPNDILTNHELASRFDNWSADKIFDKTGIKKRHIASTTENVIDLAVSAAEKIFADKNNIVMKSDIDTLILITQTSSQLIPSSACAVHKRLGLNENCASFDINQGCAGYIYGLFTANSIIKSNNSKVVLLLTSDVYSKIIDKNDASCATLFGDAGTATIIESDINNKNNSSIGNFYFGTDGTNFDKLICKRKLPNSANICDDFLKMNGPSILEFTLKKIPQAINNYLIKNNLTLDDYDYFIFHQANKFILEKLFSKIGIKHKGLIEIMDCGNTASNSIPIALEKLIYKVGYKKSKILLVGFGSGLSWGITSILV